MNKTPKQQPMKDNFGLTIIVVLTFLYLAIEVLLN